MTKTLLLLAAASSLAACRDHYVAIDQARPADPTRPGTMTVSGTATLEVSPDCADLTMTLGADGARPLTATSSVDSREGRLVAALEKLGASKDDIKLSTLSLDPTYGPNPLSLQMPYVLTGYHAAIVITVTTHDFSKIGALMEAGADAGATAMSSAFRRSDLPELKKKVREMALVAAQAKAEQTAKTLHIPLGRITSVGEAPAGAMWSNYYFPSNNVAQVAAQQPLAGAGPALGGALQPLTLDITIGYELATTT